MLCKQPVDVSLVLKLQQKLKSVESERDRLHRRLEKHDDSPSEHKAQDNFKVTLYKNILYFLLLRTPSGILARLYPSRLPRL